VRVRRVRSLGVRNLVDSEVELGAGVTLASGPNGAGKTNLLEATYLALAGRSPRTRNDREVIAFGKPLARVEADVEDERRADAPAERRTFLCAIERGGDRRHTIDGHAPGPDADELRPALSVFMPDRLVLVKGPPAGRRAHLDRFCAALWPTRAGTRRRYARALAQRNALIGRIRHGQADEASLDAWEAELGAAGVELMALRAEAVGALAGPFSDSASALGVAGGIRLRYRPRSDADEAGELVAELAERRASDLARGFTTHGPHLDELAIERSERALRRYGSQGEHRLALLALIFAEREVLLSEGRPTPLLLLDDVTSELDPERRGALCELLVAGGGQALITATESSQLPASCPRRELALRDGRVISPVEDAEAA
jgi:DNA replication and repair protein RecF